MDTPNATNANFQRLVLESDQPVMLIFWATWCPMSQSIAPMLWDIIDTYQGRINFAYVDFDKEEDIVSKCNVYRPPHLAVFSGGTKVSEIAGVPNEQEDVTGMLDKALA